MTARNLLLGPNVGDAITHRTDLDGDGKADILYRNDQTGEVYLYLMDGITIASAGFLPTTANLAWKIVNTGLMPLPVTTTAANPIADFNGAGKSDIIYRNDSTGQTYLMGRNGLGAGPFAGFGPTVAALAWKVVGVGD